MLIVVCVCVCVCVCLYGELMAKVNGVLQLSINHQIGNRFFATVSLAGI